jgi:hypothetical protein
MMIKDELRDFVAVVLQHTTVETIGDPLNRRAVSADRFGYNFELYIALWCNAARPHRF